MSGPYAPRPPARPSPTYIPPRNPVDRPKPRPKPRPTPARPDPYLAALNTLTGPQRDAAAALISMFSEYGLQSLAGRIIDMVKKGFGADTMSLMLEKTPEYQQRFAANAARIKNGLAKLSPREYIETERAYRAVMTQSGMPKGFYDSNSDYQKFLENDLAPAELNERVKSWQTVALKDQAGLQQLQRLYGMSASDYAAFMMDPKRALPLLQKQARAVTFAAAAARHGYEVSRGLSERYGGGAYDVSAEDAEKGFAAIQEVQGETDKLAKMYGLGGYDVDEAAAEVFGGDAKAGEKRKRAASAERSTFSDSSRGKTGKAKGSNY